jgi:SPP1 gp7 family putative phage head morphogenesis protein
VVDDRPTDKEAIPPEPQQEEQPKQEKQDPAALLTGSPLKSATLFKSPYFRPSYIYPYNPDPLVQGNSYSIYEEMRQDEQIKVTLSLKKDFAVGTGWQIDCEDEKVKEFITNSLTNINETMPMDTDFDDILRDMLSSYDFGFSLSEPVYELRDFPEGKLYWYKTIKTRPPHGFLIHIDDYGNVEKIEQHSDKGPQDFNPKIFLHHVYQQEFGNPFGQSDLYSAHPAWKAKKFIARFMNMYLERYASPTTVGKYKQGMTPAEIGRFHAMLETIQQNTVLTIPPDTIVDFIQAARDASDAYIKSLEYFNLQICRSILIPDLLGVGGAQTSGGSYSLGEKHFRIFMGTVQKDRNSLARKFTLKIIRPLVRANFGDIPCDFKFIPFTDDNMAEYLKIWISAVNGKTFKPNPEEINYLRRSTGFPEGAVIEPEPPPQFDKDGNPMPGKPGQKPGEKPGAGADKRSQDAQDGAKGKPGEKPQDDQELPDNDPKNARRARENALIQGGVLIFRQLTSYETKVDFVAVKRVLEASERDVTPKLERAGQDIISDFLDQVRDKGVIRRGSIQALESIQARFLKPMNSIFKSHFRGLFNEGVNQARRELFRDDSRRFAAQDLLPEELLDLLEQESFKIVGDYVAQVTKKGKNIIVQGIKDGVSEQELTRQVRELMTDESESWIATVVRTKTTEVMNDARKAYWENDPIASQLVEAYQYSAIIDERTSEVCSELDGQIFDRGDFIDRLTPPLHFNCRSVLVPVTRYENYKDDEDYVPAGKEPSLDSLREKGGNLIVGK